MQVDDLIGLMHAVDRNDLHVQESQRGGVYSKREPQISRCAPSAPLASSAQAIH